MEKMMKAVWYDKPADGKIKMIPVPECGPDEVVIKVAACSICKGVELGHATIGTGLAKYPVVPGHEFSGTVVEVGDEVTTCKVGDRVTADNTKPCGKCYYCRKGDFLHCTDFGSLGHSINGGFAEYTKVHESKIYHLDDDVSFRAACMTETVACCMHGLDRLDVKYGEHVVVIGDGPNGILLAELLAHSNAAGVIFIGRHAEKLAIAGKYGAITILNDGKADLCEKVHEIWPNGADAVVDATGNSGMIVQAFKYLRNGGRLMQYSLTGEGQKVEIDSMDFFVRELSYFATSAQVFCFDRAVEAIKNGIVNTEELVTSEYAIDDYFDALESVRSDKSQVKVVIYPGGLPQ